MRSPFDALVTQHALRFVSSHRNSDLLEAIIEDGDLPLPVKNVCAKVSVQLAAELDEVCDLLGVQKRVFLEAIFIESVQRARQIMETEGVYDVLEGGAS